MQRNLRWRYGGTLAALALFAWACSDDTTHPIAPDVAKAPTIPMFGYAAGTNGTGQCLGQDAVDAGFLHNLAVDDLNCTSNDVDISFAEITYYSINDEFGTYTALPAGQKISCVPGDHIFAVTNAKIANSAQERYDFGLWINASGSAKTGSQCIHFNLIPDDGNGSTSLDLTSDACGDIAGTDTVTIPLDTLDLVCPGGGVTTVSVDACAAWSNSTAGGNDRVCPVAAAPNVPTGFRWGTTPGTTAKCRCEPLVLPIDVKGVLRIAKVTVPGGDPQSFGFTTTGTSYATPFNLTDGQTNNSPPLSAGTYTASETVPAGWTLTDRSCVLTGTANSKAFGSISDGVSVALAAGEDVTCTFTNTKNSSLAIQKQTVGGTASFDYTVSGTGLSVFSRNTSPNNPTIASAFGLTPSQFGDKYVTETALTGYTLTNISCTANGAAIAIGTGQGGSFAQGASVGFDAGDNTVKVTIDAGDTPTCTFVNTAGGSLAIQKQTVGGTDSFDYTVSGGGLSSFSRNTATQGNPTTTAAISLTGADALGDKYVTESAKAGWTLTGISCTAGGATVLIGTGTGGSFDQNASAGYDAGDNTVKVTLAAGDSPSCTFTNTKNSSLTIQKQTVGATASFDFVGTGSDIPSAFSRNTSPNNPTTAAAFIISGANLGDKYAQETLTTGYALTGIACTANSATIVIGRGGSGTFTNGGTDGFEAGDNTVKVTVASGNTPVCTFTNTQDASLAIQKQTVGGTGSFDFIGTGAGVSANFSRNTGTANPTTDAAFAISGASLGDKFAQETIPAGYLLSNIACTATSATIVIGRGGSGTFTNGGTNGFDGGDNTVKVTVAAGSTPTCTFTNTELAALIITKTIGGDLSTSALFDFSRTLGLTYSSTPSFGPLSDGGSNNSGKILTPGDYTVCELSVAVALTVVATVEGSPATLVDTDNTSATTNLCTTVHLDPGDTKTVAFTNSLVVGTGGTRTIGYWKNWASCSRSNGKQYEKAMAPGGMGIEFTLDGNIGTSAPSIYPIGDITVLTCLEAVNLLSKNAKNGDKRPGDPIYNMVAQLLGAKLNIQAGSGSCPVMSDAGGYLERAQTLLDAINFTGLNSWPKKGAGALSPAQVTEAQFLGGKFGIFNEGTLGAPCPTHV